ncbi:hypothetical protein [Vibrio parahaemolyticus]|uniref:hypothetical protein n=2 Tax=Vibrio parahaemolyticus TaxID=670 RepID=UPI00215B842B|nr:hypothetical protein [Vibrio parahaemolyticus]HDY7722368.1 hypothetical protein [Vibrio vulnificus]MCR9821197.1 hypothetical protein [Vibrio parahaemolyticus]HCE2128432.1 hypothetical protein [Vibrio parahaemolyticus]HDY7749723.1 hypothetical protein [Vibrio vulnificus]HDY7759069.1 hypothetical protein [Vibrio vulnificus]
MKRKHEQSVADNFSSHFMRFASQQGKQVNKCSLDGQDAILGADYIFTDASNFALIEFKFEERDIKAEGRKPLRSRLCMRLDQEQNRRFQSLKCHYIAWSQNRGNRTVKLNQYYPEVCNNAIFSNEVNNRLVHDKPQVSSRVSADAVFTHFLNGTIGSNYYMFKQYTNWLMALGGHEGATIEVMLDNPYSNQLDIIDFPSLDLMKNWLDHNKPKRQNIHTPPSNSPFG